jgi:hypothetical protein
MKNYLIVLCLVFVLLLSACGSGRVTIPAGTLPPSTVQAGDDIVMTPNGGIYRAHVIEEGQTNPWPRIPTAVAIWTVGLDTVSVFYRTEIAVKAGESHPDIILITGDTSLLPDISKIELYAVKVPRGITLADTHNSAITVQGNVGTVLMVTTSPGLHAGNYSFKVGIILDGKDCGTFPCSVNVTK